MRSWKLAGRTATILVLVFSASSCARNPATGALEVALIGEQQEVRMGQEADQQIVASLGLYDDPAVAEYVQALGAALAAASERPHLPWTFRVLDDPTVNAFALPGGFVYITRGILTHLRSEAELAGVLGHEIGHITARHTVAQISRAQIAQLGLGVGMILIPELRPFGDVAGVGLQLLFLSYGRQDEREADLLGVRYMQATNHDPRHLAHVMQMLDRASQISGGSGRVPEWLSTHPNPGNRAQAIEQHIQEAEIDLTNVLVRRDEYLRRIEGTVFGTNPREGFFRENVFHHPELAFRFTFPQGWVTANTRQAVQGVAPTEDAALVINLEPGTPTEALGRFGGQSGVRLLRTSQQTVGGAPATVAEFAAAGDQGTFLGLVAFLSHGGRTFRILGYAPETRWPRHDGAIRQAVATFFRESDPQVLGIRPDRISLVSLDRSLSLEAFLRHYPSRAAPEIVALINGWDSGVVFPAGALVKRVVNGP